MLNMLGNCNKHERERLVSQRENMETSNEYVYIRQIIQATLEAVSFLFLSENVRLNPDVILVTK